MLKRLLPGGSSDPPAHYSYAASLAPPSPVFTSGTAASSSHETSSRRSPTPESHSPGYFDRRASPTFGHRPAPPTAAASPGATNPIALPLDGGVERAAMQKTSRAVESLVGAVGDLTELEIALGKVQKRVARHCKDVANCLSDGIDKTALSEDVIINAFLASERLYLALHEVTVKGSKNTEKESGHLNDFVGKAFRRLAKEEKSHEDHLEQLDGRIRKISNAFEKSRKSGRKNTIEASEAAMLSDRYYASISTLGNEVNQAKTFHASVLGVRRAEITRHVAKSLSSLGDNTWRTSCEQVKRAGKCIGEVAMYGNFCAGDGMPDRMPASLSSEGNLSMTRGVSESSDPGSTGTDSSRISAQPVSSMTHLNAPQTPNQRSNKVDTPDGMSSKSATNGLVRSNSKTLGPRPLPKPMAPKGAFFDKTALPKDGYIISLPHSPDDDQPLVPPPPLLQSASRSSSPGSFRSEVTNQIPRNVNPSTIPQPIRMHSDFPSTSPGQSPEVDKSTRPRFPREGSTPIVAKRVSFSQETTHISTPPTTAPSAVRDRDISRNMNHTIDAVEKDAVTIRHSSNPDRQPQAPILRSPEAVRTSLPSPNQVKFAPPHPPPTERRNSNFVMDESHQQTTGSGSNQERDFDSSSSVGTVHALEQQAERMEPFRSPNQLPNTLPTPGSIPMTIPNNNRRWTLNDPTFNRVREGTNDTSDDILATLTRQDSIESTASTRSFVAKMKEVYLQQKYQPDEHGRRQESRRASQDLSRSMPTKPLGGVAALTSRYTSTQQPQQAIPHHRSVPSTPLLAPTSHQQPSQRSSVGVGWTTRTTSQQGSFNGVGGGGLATPHFDRSYELHHASGSSEHIEMCACAKCSATKYNSPSLSKEGNFMTVEDEKSRLQEAKKAVMAMRQQQQAGAS